jgi:F-type H+-transporting ATPase subunit delta
MANPKAAKRYAKAVFELAREEGRTDPVREDLAALRRLLAESPELRDFLGNYMLAPARRVQLLGRLFEAHIDRLSLRFLLFLEEKKRMALLPEILDHFAKLADAGAGVLKATITSAKPLDEAQLASIRERLRRRHGKDVQTVAQLDPTLLGGFQIQMGDAIEDYSISTQLATLHRRFVTA